MRCTTLFTLAALAAPLLHAEAELRAAGLNILTGDEIKALPPDERKKAISGKYPPIRT